MSGDTLELAMVIGATSPPAGGIDSAGVDTVGGCPPPPTSGSEPADPVVLVVADTTGGAQDFEEFFQRILPVAVAVARRILLDQGAAEDAASEALARAYLRWSTLRTSDYREAWVVRVATNEALGILRKRSRRDRVLRRQPSPPFAAAADAAVGDRLLLARVQALPRRQREVVAMRYFAEMTTDEVAAALDISSGSVKTHLHRAIASLRAHGPGALGEALDG